MLHLAARLQRLAACAPRLAGFPGSFSSLLPLPALCQLLSTCSGAQLQPQERMRAVQLSSLLPLATRTGQEHAGADTLLSETRNAGYWRVESGLKACIVLAKVHECVCRQCRPAATSTACLPSQPGGVGGASRRARAQRGPGAPRRQHSARARQTSLACIPSSFHSPGSRRGSRV